MAQGWVSIHREIWNSWVWKDKPFSKGQAWIDLILMANHEDKKVLVGNSLVLVKRGSHITSIRQLCSRWGWSNTKIKSFLLLLEKESMIAVKSDTRKTAITIVNYSDYQDQNITKNVTETSLKHTNNNDNNDNNNIYSAKNEQNAQLAENIWKLYPCKKGKARAIQKIPKLIQKYGYEQIENTVLRYKRYVQHRRETDFKDLKYQNGSTFFSGTYMDYLDENYTEESEQNSNVQMFDFSDD